MTLIHMQSGTPFIIFTCSTTNGVVVSCHVDVYIYICECACLLCVLMMYVHRALKQQQQKAAIVLFSLLVQWANRIPKSSNQYHVYQSCSSCTSRNMVPKHVFKSIKRTCTLPIRDPCLESYLQGSAVCVSSRRMQSELSTQAPTLEWVFLWLHKHVQDKTGDETQVLPLSDQLGEQMLPQQLVGRVCVSVCAHKRQEAAGVKLNFVFQSGLPGL